VVARPALSAANAFRRRAARLVAKRSRGAQPLPKVHCIDTAPDPKESTMIRTIAAQAVSFSLALVVTIGTLIGLDSLASTDHPAQQQIAATQSSQG
jgi:hypothetical protein